MASDLIQLVFVALEEHRVLTRFAWNGHLVECTQQDVAHPQELAWLDRSRNAPPQSIPVAMIDRCRSSIAIEDRIDPDRELEGYLQKSPSVGAVRRDAVHHHTHLLSDRRPIFVADRLYQVLR